MKKNLKSISIILLLIAIQLGNHKLFINASINQWGATDLESAASMPNDDKAGFIVSTRAITINKPKHKVWLWINQLGADRSGFFSYYFIEKAMGYYTREQQIITADFPEFKITDSIRGSIKPEDSLILYDFPITDVKSGEYFTTANWGTFLVTAIDEDSTRLIIRTHGQDRSGFIANGVDYIAYALHFIMERATLNGLKARIEFGDGPAFYALTDTLWFSFVVISGLIIGLWVFLLRGIKTILIPIIFSTFWLFSTFMAPASPVFPGMLTVFLLLSLWIKTRATKTS